MRRVWVLAAAMVAMAACGDDEGGSGGAKKKCETLVDTLCERIVECAVEGDLFESSEEDDQLASCKRTLRENAGCEDAVSVTEDYDDCLEESENLECSESNEALMSEVNPIPASCEEVIAYDE